MASADPHPDADLLTAFAEHSLASRERGEVVKHLACCSDCREVVAAALPATEILPHATVVRSGRRMGAWPVLHWASLAAGLVILISVGILGYQYQHREQLVATNFMNAVIPEKARVEKRQAIEPAVEAPGAMAATPGQEEVVKAKDPVAPVSTPLAAAPALEPPPGFSTTVAAQWQVSTSGTLQRSQDGAKTWEIVNPEPNAEQKNLIFRSVAADGQNVWAGGSEGRLYRSTDGGERWVRVMLSTPDDVLSGDIIIIQFSDPQRGEIVTSTGQLWTSVDAGKSWQKQ
jgi:hypothetical protein